MKKIKLYLVIIFTLTLCLPTFNAKAENTAMRLDVPSFRQVWEPWVNQNVGYSQMNFEMGGCAITSLSMVMKYYGVDTDPARLNNWLKENNGFAYGAAIIWSKASEAGSGIYLKGIHSFNGVADLELIKAQIDRGYPVIAQMGYKGTDHYVVICGYSDSEFYINDPWYENPGHTLDTLVEFGDIFVSYDNYQNPTAAIKSVVLFETTNSTPSKIPVVTIASMFSEYPQLDIYTLKTPVIEMQVGDPYMYVNGTKKIVDPVEGVSPQIINDRTLVPIRAIIEEMGGSISWNGRDEKVTISVQNRTMEMWIGAKTAYINKYYFEFDVVPQIIDERTFIPIRFVTEQLGCEVGWDSINQKIKISSK